MNRFRIYTTTFLLVFAQVVFAQKTKTDANLTGDVQCNGEHVPFINIVLEGTTIGATTDATGHFQITNIPLGTYTVRVSGVGYKSTTKEILAEKNVTKEIKFAIQRDVLNLEEVVVSADRNQTSRREAPVIINSLAPELFELTQSVNLAEGLCFTPGLRTECNCQNCGFTQLRMNGLDGAYTQVLMNSRPVFSGLAGVYGLELIPANMIERLEVVKGGGSALFGGSAIAGTVNIITKEPTRNTFSIDARYGLTGVGAEGRDSHEQGEPAGDAQVNFNASVVTDDRKSGAYIYSMLRDRQAHDENGDGYSESVLIHNTTFGFSAYHKPGARSKITLDGYRVNEFRRGGNKLDMLPHEADIAEQVEHTITGGNLSFDKFINSNHDKFTAYTSVQVVDRESYYGAEQNPGGYGKSDDLSTSIGLQYIKKANNFLFAPSSTVFGVDNNTNILDDKKMGINGAPNIIISNQTLNTLGFFAQHDWKADDFNMSMGLRYDNYLVRDLHNHGEPANDVRESVFVPRAGILYKLTPNIRFRAGYAMGYQAPRIFSEDLHVELVNATLVKHQNASDLTQETSHSVTASINGDLVLGNAVNNLLVEGFYTKLLDAFANTYYEDEATEDLNDFINLRENVEEGATVFGVNIEYNLHLLKSVEADVGFTAQKSQYDAEVAWGEAEDAVTNKFLKAPRTYGYASLNLDLVKNLKTSITANYTGSMYVPHFGLAPGDYTQALSDGIIDEGDVIIGERLEHTEDFLIFDALFTYTFYLTSETKLQLYAGMKNIFNQTQKQHDRGIYRDAGYIYGPCQPRTINVGLKLANF